MLVSTDRRNHCEANAPLDKLLNHVRFDLAIQVFNFCVRILRTQVEVLSMSSVRAIVLSCIQLMHAI